MSEVVPGLASYPYPDAIGLFVELLDKGLSLRVKVTGRSMAPFLKGGEVVTIRKVPCSHLRRGDLIFFRNRYGAPVLHRIIKKKRADQGRFIFLTRGDAMKTFDGPVQDEDILGRVCRIKSAEPGTVFKYNDMDSPLQRKINGIIAAINLLESNLYSLYMRARTAVMP